MSNRSNMTPAERSAHEAEVRERLGMKLGESIYDSLRNIRAYYGMGYPKVVEPEPSENTSTVPELVEGI